MGFSRHECWSGLPFPSSGDLSDPGIEPGSPALQADALPSEPPGKANKDIKRHKYYFSGTRKTRTVKAGVMVCRTRYICKNHNFPHENYKDQMVK